MYLDVTRTAADELGLSLQAFDARSRDELRDDRHVAGLAVLAVNSSMALVPLLALPLLAVQRAGAHALVSRHREGVSLVELRLHLPRPACAEPIHREARGRGQGRRGMQPAYLAFRGAEPGRASSSERARCALTMWQVVM